MVNFRMNYLHLTVDCVRHDRLRQPREEVVTSTQIHSQSSLAKYKLSFLDVTPHVFTLLADSLMAAKQLEDQDSCGLWVGCSVYTLH